MFAGALVTTGRNVLVSRRASEQAVVSGGGVEAFGHECVRFCCPVLPARAVAHLAHPDHACLIRGTR
jgi:hypothetical protein